MNESSIPTGTTFLILDLLPEVVSDNTRFNKAGDAPVVPANYDYLMSYIWYDYPAGSKYRSTPASLIFIGKVGINHESATRIELLLVARKVFANLTASMVTKVTMRELWSLVGHMKFGDPACQRSKTIFDQAIHNWTT